jgi:hypothetical protein
MRRWLSKSSDAFLTLGLVAIFLPALDAYGESSLKTRNPSESKEYDRDDNGKIDSYSEKFSLGKGLTLHTLERLSEDSRELVGRVTMIQLDDQQLWTETWNPQLGERSSEVSRNCPFDVKMSNIARSGETIVMMLDEKPRLVAILIRERDGRYAPVTVEELARIGKLSQAVSDFAFGVLNRAEELKDAPDEANKLLRSLEQSVDDYNQAISDPTKSTNEPEN